MRRRLAIFGVVAGLSATPVAAQDFTTLKGHGGPIMGLAVSASGQVASASFDNSVGLWAEREPVWLDGHDAAVVDLVFAADGTIVSGGDDFSVRHWQSGGSEELGRHEGKVTDLAVSPNGDVVASASWDGTIGLWPLGSGETGRLLDGHNTGINDVEFSADGGLLFAATSDGDILIHDLTRENAVRRLIQNGFGINELILSPDNSWLAFGAVDGVTRVVDPDSGAEIVDFTLDRRPILALAHHPGTNALAVGDGHGFIMIIDTATWQIARDFQAMREGPVWALAFSPDGRTIYAGGVDDVVYGWPVELLDTFEPAGGAERTFLKDADTMSNGERQFMRKCSICHDLTGANRRKAGPTLAGVFGRRAGTVPGYHYSATLEGSEITWDAQSIDDLFSLGPDNYIPKSKMPMQRITGEQDRIDLIEFLKIATQ